MRKASRKLGMQNPFVMVMYLAQTKEWNVVYELENERPFWRAWVTKRGL